VGLGQSPKFDDWNSPKSQNLPSQANVGVSIFFCVVCCFFFGGGEFQPQKLKVSTVVSAVFMLNWGYHSSWFQAPNFQKKKMARKPLERPRLVVHPSKVNEYLPLEWVFWHINLPSPMSTGNDYHISTTSTSHPDITELTPTAQQIIPESSSLPNFFGTFGWAILSGFFKEPCLGFRRSTWGSGGQHVNHWCDWCLGFKT